MSNITAPQNAWEQRHDETDTAYHRFTIYFEMGPERSLEKTRQELGKRSGYLRQLQTWSSKYSWVKRAREYDRHVVSKLLKDKQKVVDHATGRLIGMVDRALDELETVLTMDNLVLLSESTEGKNGEETFKRYTSIITQKLKAVEMVLNRVGLIEQKEIEKPKGTTITNYIQNIYNRAETISKGEVDEG